jgi:hypothetical protein
VRNSSIDPPAGAAADSPSDRTPESRYLERLTPSAGMWVVSLALGVCAGIIVLPISGPGAFVAAVLVAGGCAAGLLGTSVVVGVREGEVLAGRAHLPVRHVARVEALGRDATRAAVGPELDARSMLRIRPWVHTAVRLTLNDPEDPVPAWVVSTRRPERFAAAVAAAKLSDPRSVPGTQ